MKLLRKAIGLLALAQLMAAPASAQHPALDSLFPPRPANYLTDVAGIVDGATAAAINDLAARVRGATGAEIAVVTLPTIGDRAAVDVATEIGRVWGVGAAAKIGDVRRNAGVVLMVVPMQGHRPGTGQVFIAVGRGLEGMITDTRAGEVRDLMIPDLADERYGAALLAGTRALSTLIARGFGVTDSTIAGWPVSAPEPSGGGQFPWPILFVVLIIILQFAVRNRRGRGPRIFWGGGFGGFGGGGFSGGGFGGGGGGFGGFGGGGGFSGGGAGGRF